MACLLTASVMNAEDIFVSKVETLLKQRCFECHSHEKKIKGGLALDSKLGWEKGGASGPAIVPGKPEASLLMQALSHAEKDVKMPPKKMLPASEIAVFAEWIRLGAPDPRVSEVKNTQDLVADDTWGGEFHKRLDWWSLRPMLKAEPPGVDDETWSKEPVDRFVRAALAAAKIQPAPPAEPGVLRRRLSFVLTGLPPSSASASLSDEAYVDMLLQSPRFGEHFARHWMDVVRYTDTYGYEWDNPAKGAYEYRDYLIRAFNDDISFAQFVREQIAGDLLPVPRINTASQTNESLIGPMFYHLGEHRHGSSLMFNGIHQEMVNNKIDAFSKAFLATTVACARCHDHKLEAVSQRDYYALAAVFTTPRWTSRVIDAPNKNDVAIAKLKELRAAIRAELAVVWAKPFEAPFLKQWAETHGNELKGVGAPLAAPGQFTQKAAEWRKARVAAQNSNAMFKPLADPAKAQLPHGWVIEGDGMKHGFAEEGTPLIALEGDAVIARLLPRGWHTHALSSKLPGALRMPPEHLIPGRFVSLDLAGGEFGGQLVIDDHAFQNETISFYTNTIPAWRAFADAELKNGVQQVTVEFATSSLNPNFPPRTGLAKGLKNNDFGYDKRSWLSVCGIVSHDKAGAPQDEQAAFAGLYDAAGSLDSWECIAAWFNSAVTRWCEGKTQPGDQPVLDWLLSSGLLPNKAEPGSRLATLVAEYRSVEAGIDFSRTVNSMDQRETSPASYPLNVRGNVDVPGTLVQPGFLKMLDPGALVSDRLALAESLLDPEHPLTARVYVNRVWQWLFGTGLVATPDDFGRLGDKPSHPELLDWLAREFIREGWSTKKLVRRLVLSQAFRQSGLVAEAARERDPANRLLHHYPTRRLEAEAIRDSLLAISGHLDSQLYGRPVLPFRSTEDAAKRLFSGPLDGRGRRSIYLQMSIMDPPKFLVGFNLPDLKLPAGRRDVTNVPAQALIMLNDPFVNEMAKCWSAGLLKDTGKDREDRVRQMFGQALARKPDAVELKRWTAALQDFGGDTPDAWERLAHALFNTKEFLYYR
ncbi:MAG: PSD1 and planctomycete cytochrome C domain-containing protein [Prosthecobacter sp.]|uniref:PSD1 and planctomycete cytochrome C domain-containing protein n=1 Tax=Prosthecobacter sp. TaxID=1965333 RepID=UPI0025FE54B2|nr:PSD1 and planctomycete cytochrome C domain-containing protein [Prosthecobacter sp.]MCF7787918.1 PSD1 and planctomycete cytochrome C domain-containing protein [Prosthecobacter sp.]